MSAKQNNCKHEDCVHVIMNACHDYKCVCYWVMWVINEIRAATPSVCFSPIRRVLFACRYETDRTNITHTHTHYINMLSDCTSSEYLSWMYDSPVHTCICIIDDDGNIIFSLWFVIIIPRLWNTRAFVWTSVQMVEHSFKAVFICSAGRERTPATKDSVILVSLINVHSFCCFF